MRIAYVGNYTQSHCTEVHIAKTLEDLGHQVERLQENELPPWWAKDLPDNTDLVLYTRTWGDKVTLDDLAQLRERKITTASYHLDLYVGLSRKYLHEGKAIEEVLQNDPFWRTDFVFTPDGDPKSAELFKANGVNHHYIKAAVFKPECQMVPDNQDGKLFDVLFVGGGARPGEPNGYGHPEWQYRNELIGWLQDTYGDRFKKYGHPQQTIRNQELNQLYANFKIVVGDSVCIDFKHENYWSDRVYETLGRGGFIIHPYIKGMDEEFEDGKTIVFYEYNNWDQLKEKIDYYLEHDDEREAIRRAGHEFVKNHATYHDRLKQALAIINPSNESPKRADSTIKINLGAGSEPTEGWINVDWIDQPGIDVVHNLLNFPWPFDDGVADEIKAIDVLEHMPNFTNGKRATGIAFVEECHRILQPGGKLIIQVPHWDSPNLWIDPTHVRGYDPRSFDYFDPETDFGKWYGYYSAKKFKVTGEVSRLHNDPNGPVGNVTFTMVKR